MTITIQGMVCDQCGYRAPDGLLKNVGQCSECLDDTCTSCNPNMEADEGRFDGVCLTCVEAEVR